MDKIKETLVNGTLIPFLGMGVFKGAIASDGSILPFDSDSMSLALNDNRPMSTRLMYEYTRVAMSLEQRKGREFIVEMTNHIYSSKQYELPPIYQYLKTVQPKYMIDTNLDDSACKIYEDVEHFMIVGISRIMGSQDRFIIYKYDVNTKNYNEIYKEDLNTSIPILFKPLGSTMPRKNFIISDADFVDWLTEAMAGFAMPPLLKRYKEGRSYLFLGVDFSKDTYRMVANELTLGLNDGYIVDDKNLLSKKEERFVATHNLSKVALGLEDFIKGL
ncbi:MAG: SIR2 family protein [Sulfurovaceae bacterium]|nr:SIR2 family protein [Sulfurovaceae bacterium]